MLTRGGSRPQAHSRRRPARVLLLLLLLLLLQL
jgi:hypothetical protein